MASQVVTFRETQGAYKCGLAVNFMETFPVVVAEWDKQARGNSALSCVPTERGSTLWGLRIKGTFPVFTKNQVAVGLRAVEQRYAYPPQPSSLYHG